MKPAEKLRSSSSFESFSFFMTACFFAWSRSFSLTTKERKSPINALLAGAATLAGASADAAGNAVACADGETEVLWLCAAPLTTLRGADPSADEVTIAGTGSAGEDEAVESAGAGPLTVRLAAAAAAAARAPGGT